MLGTTFLWEKLGQVFVPTTLHPSWMASHAALPFTKIIDASHIEIFFTTRNPQNQSQLASIIVNMNEPFEVVEYTKAPLLAPGPLGYFDDSGAMGSCLVQTPDQQDWLFYTGWMLCLKVPFQFGIGLAQRRSPQKNFEKISPAPILHRSNHDPIMMASPCVLNTSEGWQMWYVSATQWEEAPKSIEDAVPKHFYRIHYAQSPDGIHWVSQGVCLDYQNDAEYAMGRPCVTLDATGYHMWFCARGLRYHLAYAFSSDGRRWIRNDTKIELRGESSGWDHEMQCYPWVFEFNHQTYLLYNGNDYGKTGFGLARLSR